MNSSANKLFDLRFSIVAPAYNEARSIPVLIDALREIFGSGDDYEILIINDGSSDETASVLKALSESFRCVRYINFSRNFGHQAALRAGLTHAKGACVIAMDADLQHPPEVIPQLVEKWRLGYKIVRTRRNDTKATPFFKKVTSRLFYRLISFLSGVKFESGVADFYLLDRQVVDTICSYSERRWFLRGILPSLGYKNCVVDYAVAQRRFGDSRYTLGKMVNLAIDGVLATSITPLRGSVFLAALIASFAVIYAVYAVYASVFLGAALPGWTSVMLAVTIIGAMQLLMLGVIGEYLGRVLLEIRLRPDYIIETSNVEDVNERSDREEVKRVI